MRLPRQRKPATRRAQTFRTPSGLGGSFTVSIMEKIDATTVKVRVHYPTRDWDGYSFTTTRDKLSPEGWTTIEAETTHGRLAG